LIAPGASPKSDATFGGFIFTRGTLQTANIDTKPGLNYLTIVACHHPKVSKIGSPRCLDVVGENLIEN
jgi:hypothetical protein